MKFAPALTLCVLSAAVTHSATAAACFTPSEAQAAHFRMLQQEFNVAALNCRAVDEGGPSFPDRYNVFVGKFSETLQQNAKMLHHHFTNADEFDRWMTSLANHAGHSVHTDPDFCQHAWENLDRTMEVEPAFVENFVAQMAEAQPDPLVPVCPAGPHKKTAAAQ